MRASAAGGAGPAVVRLGGAVDSGAGGAGADGFVVDTAGRDDDAVGRDDHDGVAGNLGAGGKDGGVVVLHVDLKHRGGVDAELGEGSGVHGAGVLLAELMGGDGAGVDVSEGDGAAAPAHGVLTIGERGADKGLALLRGPAAGVGGGKDADDAPGSAQ